VTVCFDIDGVIATVVDDCDYSKAKPISEMVWTIRQLHKQGHEIILYTARGTKTKIDWRAVTEQQMRDWGVPFDQLLFGKPAADYYVDDRSLSIAAAKDMATAGVWSSCSRTFAHLDIDKWLVSEQELRRYWSKQLSWFDFGGKTVLDYGIGGGYFGKWLYEEQSIAKYIGVDIAERSLKKAEEVLQQYPQTELYLTPVRFSEFGVTVFTSLACIQHFQLKSQYEALLKNVESSRIADVVIQIRHGTSPHFNQSNIRLGCLTNAAEVVRLLPSYVLERACPIQDSSSYQFLHLNRAKETS